MPWCETCNQFQDREALTDNGECPSCGRVLLERKRVPWHFKLLIVATAIYLTYRLVQGIVWLTHHA